MLARSKAVALVALLAGCATLAPPPPTPAPIVTAPAVTAWTCAEQRQAKAELAAMPAGSITPRLVADYLRMRDESRAARGESEPKACP